MKQNAENDLEELLLRKEIERCIDAGAALEVIYFGGGLPGMSRVIRPRRFSDSTYKNRIVAYCERSETEKTFRLDRMHLPCPPLEQGLNDFRVISLCLGNSQMLESMLGQIARLNKLPIEQALSMHLDARKSLESFFDEYPYGGYTMELQFTSTVIYLSLGVEANDCEMMHYHFSPEREPKLAPEIVNCYHL